MLGLGRTTIRTGRLSGHGPLLLLVAILVLSAYTHMWNTAGFPSWHPDESTYIGRALDVLDHRILPYNHDHPFLGWTMLAGFLHATGSAYPHEYHDISSITMLAGFLHATGYPDFLVTPEEASSLGMLYGAPRILMGLLAVLDTFLIYKIVERGFGRRIAPIAAILFAAMPVSMTLRLVLLDSILLPFVLSSVLLAMHARGPNPKDGPSQRGASLQPGPDRIRLLIILSGVCMGCAMLVKVPSLVMIPLVLALVWSAGRRPGRVLLWLVPAILIAAAWPASAALAGDFDGWVDGVLWHTDRGSQSKLDLLQQYTSIALVYDQDPDILTRPAIMLVATILLFEMDPVMVSLGTAGLAFAVASRNRFLLLWAAPVLLFFGSIGFVTYLYHLGMLWTVMCIAAAALIGAGIERASARIQDPGRQRTLLLAALLAVAALGLSTSGVFVHWDTMSAYPSALFFALQNYAGSDAEIIMWLINESWRLHGYNITHSSLDRYDLYDTRPHKTNKIVMIDSVDRVKFHRNVLETGGGDGGNATASPETDWSQRYVDIYDGSDRVIEFQGPSKPDTPIPSKFHRHFSSSMEVTVWNPPGWTSLPAYGPAGRALHLDGTAYVTLAAAPGLDLGGADPFSIAFWIKMLEPGNPDSLIISKADAARQQGITVWGNPYGGISFRMADDAQSQITVGTFSGMTDGRWHHIVFTYDGSGDRGGLDVYVDGQIDNLRWYNTSLAGSVANDHRLAIGASSIGRNPAQDTVLDDIMIYSARLPADYISDVHKCHVEMATVSDTKGTGTVDALTGDHACMGDYDGALLMHLEFEGDLSDSSGGGNGGTAHGDVKYT